MDNILLEKAIEYVHRGWYVFPCREKDSKPFINDKGKEVVVPAKAPYLRGGFKSSTRDLSLIKSWWKKYPEACIGVSCEPSGLTVIDVDVRNGKKGFDSFVSMNVSDEGALHAVTASGGLHIIYKGLINSHANVKAGVDVRSIGAYFIVPPSYIWENGEKKHYIMADDWNREPIKIPTNLEEKLDWLRGKEKKQVSQKQYPKESLDKTILRVKKALDTLPQWMVEDYFTWVNIGMALKTLGESGFSLWDNWSRKSNKYDYDALLYRWENFQPNSITIASIFHYARNAPKELV